MIKMSVYTSSNSDSLDKEYNILEVLINLPRFRIYCYRKTISTCLDPPLMIMFLKSDFGNGVILYGNDLSILFFSFISGWIKTHSWFNLLQYDLKQSSNRSF